jgi:hypothetical protein
MDLKQVVQAVGYRRLASDVAALDDPTTRIAGEVSPEVDEEDEEQLAADAAEAAAASASNVRLDTLVNRFRQNRLYEE